MIGAIHDEFNTGSDLAEFPNDQFITEPFIMMRNMAFKFRIGNLGKISDDDIWIGNCRFDIDFFVISRNGMNHIWIRYFPAFHTNHILKLQYNG